MLSPSQDTITRNCLYRGEQVVGWIVTASIALVWWFVGLWTGVPTALAQTHLTEIQFEQLEQVFDRAMRSSQQGNFVEAEDRWSEAIEQFPDNPALWSNRGNVRVSQNHLEAALSDYNRAIELAPEVPDPYLNRGTVYEALQRWDDAIADYNCVLDLSPDDPAAYNNRGNAKAGRGNWEDAAADYKTAVELAPDFAFARANYALALYQIGKTDEAVRRMKNIVRRYPQFADMRAALTASLWAKGSLGEAESNWVAAYGLDSRYGDLEWVARIRRWPPRMVEALGNFLNLSGR